LAVKPAVAAAAGSGLRVTRWMSLPSSQQATRKPWTSIRMSYQRPVSILPGTGASVEQNTHVQL
jgi:hypothetical protein